MAVDLQRIKRQKLYDSILKERHVNFLLRGLTVSQYLDRLPQRHPSPETESFEAQPLLLGHQ